MSVLLNTGSTQGQDARTRPRGMLVTVMGGSTPSHSRELLHYPWRRRVFPLIATENGGSNQPREPHLQEHWVAHTGFQGEKTRQTGRWEGKGEKDVVRIGVE